MKLEVGMYVRTEKGIAKIKKIFPDGSEPYFEAKYETDTYLEIYYDSEYVSEDYVLKASYNIIDILEEGDYVNGCKVHRIANCITIILDNEENISWVNPSNIKSIVTKEQFSSMEYRLGDDK